MTRVERLAEIARLAVHAERAIHRPGEPGCPAEMTVGQWAMESSWGERAPGHNAFGIKRAKRHPNWNLTWTREVVRAGHPVLTHPDAVIEDLPGNVFSVRLPMEFAAYDSLSDAVADYAWLITNGEPYRAAWQGYLADRDLYDLIEGVARVYATDPGYCALLTTIAHQRNVRDAVAKARQGVAA